MRNFSLVWLSVAFIACNMKRIDTSEAVKQIKQTEVKRITSAQVNTFANKWGGEITEVLNSKSPKKALIDSLSGAYKASIDTINLIQAFPKNLAPKELALYEAYKYSMQHNLPLEPNMQNLENGDKILYNSPVAFSKNTLWRIVFSKKEVIKRVNIKELKKIVTE
jgi:hypothetical protein